MYKDIYHRIIYIKKNKKQPKYQKKMEMSTKSCYIFKIKWESNYNYVFIEYMMPWGSGGEKTIRQK